MKSIRKLCTVLAALMLSVAVGCGGPDDEATETAEGATSGTQYATQSSVNAAYNRCVSTCNSQPRPKPNPRDPLSGGPCTMTCCSDAAAFGVGAGGEVIIASQCL